MSLQATTAVWEHSQSTGAARLVLLCIAEHANDDGIAWPGLSRIVEMTKSSRRTAQRAISQLEEMGELVVLEKGDGRGNSTRYQITLKGVILSKKGVMVTPNQDIKGDDMTPFSEEKGGDMTPIETVKGDILTQKGVILSKKGVMVTPEPYITIIEPKEDIYIPPDPEPIAKIKTALSEISATSVLMKPDEYDKAAYELCGWDASPDDIRGFRSWWDQNGYYNGRPHIKSIVEKWHDYRDGVTVAKSSKQVLSKPAVSTGLVPDSSGLM